MRLLILGTGVMAAKHARSFAAIDGVSVVGGVDVEPERLAAFNAEHGIERGFASLEEALAWGDFDAIANVTPDSVHHPTTLAAFAAGKHVFCEKPLSTDAVLAAEMTQAAGAAGLVAMVNLTYRNSPGLQKCRQLVLDGAIGTVRHIDASYLQSWLVNKAWGDWQTESRWLWRLSRKHGSNGALGDIGIHIVDFACYGAGLDIESLYARLKTFDKAPGGRIGEYELDANDCFWMTCGFKGGAAGTIQASRTACGQLDELRLRIFGDKGALDTSYEGGHTTLRACIGQADLDSGTWRDIPFEPTQTNYQRFAEAVRTGKTQEPSFQRATDIQRILDLALVSDAENRQLPVA